MAAPKGNRFALGHGFGRPATYETVNDLVNKAEEYFNLETTATGICKPTISGLMFHLGFASRQSFYDYKKRSQDFSYAINALEQFIESCYEKNLHGYNWAGSAFALRNIRGEYWKEETTQHQNQVITHVQPQVINTQVPFANKESQVE